MLEPVLKMKTQMKTKKKRLAKLQKLLDEQEVQLKNLKESMEFNGNDTAENVNVKSDGVLKVCLKLMHI
jgi:hypothetical protein